MSEFGLSKAEIMWLEGLGGVWVTGISLERSAGWLIATVERDIAAPPPRSETYSRHEGTGLSELDRGEDAPRRLTDDGEPVDVA